MQRTLYMLKYAITEDDFLPNIRFPSSCVLQTKYNTQNKAKIDEKFNRQVVKYRELYRSKKITIEQVNIALYEVVDSLNEQFPDDFPDEDTLGWFSKNLLASLYLQGHVTLIGYTHLQLRTKEKEDKLQLQKNIVAEKANKERIRLASRLPVQVGTIFKTKYCIEAAYFNLMPFKLKRKDVPAFLATYLTTEYITTEDTHGKVWVVTEVKQEGGMITTYKCT